MPAPISINNDMEQTMPELWEARLKHERDLRDGYVKCGNPAPSQPDPSGGFYPVIPRRYNGTIMSEHMSENGHDTMNFDDCRCKHTSRWGTTRKVDHFEWLKQHLPAFFERNGVSWEWNGGIIVAHGDKAYCYEHEWNKHGIPFERGVAVFLLSYCRPYAEEVREQHDGGFVAVCSWVVKHYRRFWPEEADRTVYAFRENDPPEQTAVWERRAQELPIDPGGATPIRGGRRSVRDNPRIPPSTEK